MIKTSEIKDRLDKLRINHQMTVDDSVVTELEEAINEYENDSRKTVQNLIAQYKKKRDAYLEEVVRSKKMKQYEQQYKQYEYICGIDEVGRGPLAGPVVACAVILPKDCDILYINDSKKLSEEKRELLYELICEKAISIGIGIVGPDVIDEINILQATYEAMRNALSKLNVKPEVLLNDAVTIPQVEGIQVPIIKGDTKSISIAAASIVAKVTRDRMMKEYDILFPEYGFASNKGYGAKGHIDALKNIGACSIHRKSFIKNFM